MLKSWSVRARWLGGLALLSVLGCDTPRGVEYDGRRLPVVDMHLHPGEWDGIPSDTQRFACSAGRRV